VAGFKLYLAETTGNLLLPTRALPLALAAIERTGKPVSLHCEDQALIEQARARLQDRTDPLVHYEVRTPESEVASVKSVLPLLRGMRANICHLSTRGALALIESQKRNGQQLACEVTPHHLFSTRDAVSQQGNYLKSNPPLRSEEDRQALLAALKAGRIDFLATDHAPHTPEEKERGVWQAPSGVPGLDTYGNFLAWLIVTQELHPTVATQVTSANPARFLGLTDRGGIVAGQRADFAILDVHHPERVSREHLYTKCGWSPFEGMTFPGRVRWTIHKGRILQDDFEMHV
jgi:dihydroorotase